MWKSPLLFVPAFTMCIVTGCGESFTALPADGQVPVGKNQGILEKLTDVAVLVRSRSIPWDDGHRFTAFNVEITNSRTEPLAIGPGRFSLVDEEGIARGAIDPTVLERAFQSAVTDASAGVPEYLRHAVAAGYGYDPHHGRASYYWYQGHRRHYIGPYYRYFGPYYGAPWYFGWGPYYYDYYDEMYEQQVARERIAQFLAELLRKRELEPDEATSGNVLFAYHPEKGETVTVRLELNAPGRAESRPAQKPDEEVRFEFRFLRSR